MREKKLKSSLLCVVVLLFGFAGSAFGDWDEGGPYKMHYPQLPNPVGWDVAFYGDLGMVPLELADDWQCTETGPVRDIHFWISWMGDLVDPIIGIQAKIYSNNPMGPSGWSEPDYLLWEGVFQAGQFTERLYGSGPQGWYDPFFPEWFPDDHFQYYQINITDISEPFIQQVGEIYWLSLEIATPGGLVGWKTAIPPNFMDDAVWREPGGPAWIELKDPVTLDSLDFSFVITVEPPPANDDCENAEPVGDVTGLPFDTTAATFDGLATCMYSPNIWYCYTATCTGIVTVSLCGSSYNTMLAVYDGCTCDPLGTELGCNDDYCGLQSEINFAATEGNEYLIEVGGYDTSRGQGLLSISCSPPPPANDDCENAEPVGDVTDLPFDTTAATFDGLGTCMYSPNIWYCYTATCTGFVTVSLCGSSYNTMLAVYDGCTCDPLGTVLDCNDDYCGLQSEITFAATAGNEYLIEVGGYDTGTGQGLLSISCEPVYDKPLEPHTKWSQPPIEVDPNSAVPMYCGWDEESCLLPSSGVQVYENFDSNASGWYFSASGADLLADDIYLAGTNRELVHYNFTVSALGGTVPYIVTSELYTDNSGYPGTPIAGTSWMHTVTSDGDVVLDCAPGPGVILPDKVWIVLSFSPKETWWKGGEAAEFGFTDDLFALYNYGGSGVWDLYWFEAHDPYAGFEANIWCEGVSFVADDFRCIGSMPVTSIHWWGSYIGWEGLEPPQPEPIAWRIGFWSNVPEGIDANYSHPQELLWQIEVPVDRVDVRNVGRDSFPQMPSDTCFQYYLDLNEEEYFRQGEFEPNTIDNIFWLSIAAVYPELVVIEYPWGWKTRPWHWMDDAVTFTLNFAPAPGFALDPNFVNPIEDPGSGESYDLAFELDTDPNYIKWEQLYTGIRHWPHYEDEKSVGVTERWTEVETKWLQEPDLSPNGIDVDATMELTTEPLFPPQILADDFPCTTMGPITGISIWGSWYDDMMPMMDPTAVEFTLSIYSDNPMGPSGWSEPDMLLWRMDFPAGTFMVEPAGEGPEGYYSPCVSEYEPVNHFFAWKYSFNIDPAQAFVQQGDPMIYWLAVQARPIPDEIFTYRFGWKTSTMQWNDDAVWTIGELDPFQPWTELLHPENSLLSLDLAFEITTSQEFEEFVIEQLVADDWRCERRTPVTAIAWWGSYIGYGYEACQGPVIDVPVKPDYFQLNIWTDVAAGEDPCVSYSHPNEIIWEYKAYDYDEVLVGYDKDPNGEPNEPVFRYSVSLPEEEWFKQRDVNSIFWLSILAVYDVNTPNYEWGWTNHEHVFNDNAVGRYYDDVNEVWVWEELYDQTGASEDMSFMLFTDPNECVNCADYNSDGIVDTRDLKIFADNWLWIGPSGGYCDSDLNCDGEATFVDYAIFAQQWLDSCP